MSSSSCRKFPKAPRDQHVVVGRERAGLIAQVSGGIGDDKEFAQGKGDPLPQLVGRGNRKGPPRILRLGHGRRVNPRRIDEREMRRERRRELLVQECVEALVLDGCNQRIGRAKSCLGKESTRIGHRGRA